MTLINLNKVVDVFVNKIRDDFNLAEKIELSRILLNSIERDHNKIIAQGALK